MNTTEQQEGRYCSVLLDDKTIAMCGGGQHIKQLLRHFSRAVRNEQANFPDSSLAKAGLLSSTEFYEHRTPVPSLACVLGVLVDPLARRRLEERKPQVFKPGVMSDLQNFAQKVAAKVDAGELRRRDFVAMPARIG